MLKTVSEQITDRERTRATLAREISFLEKLPAELAVADVRESSSGWHITLESPLKTVLERLPPTYAEMHRDHGDWRAAPKKAPVDWTAPVLPLTEAYNKVTWFHYLPDDTLVQVSVAKSRLPECPGYVVVDGDHERVLRRKLKPVPGLRLDPVSVEREAWEAFYTAESYNCRQLQFAQAVQVLSGRNIRLNMKMLPVLPKEELTMEVAGEQLLICRAGNFEPKETVPEGSPLQSFSNIGRFWNAFSVAEATRLVDFSNSRCKDLDTIRDQTFQSQMELIKAALTDFQNRYLTQPPANEPVNGVFQYWLKQQTKLNSSVTVSLDRSRRRQGWLDLRVHLWWHRSEELSIAWPVGEADPKGFDFKNPPFYEYEENLGRF